ncbi:hypothetical protein [Mumia zhuanghuii]|uniref:YtxH domain-containing protein n=1 Tax=Mumia zhuanghuii TaxID=2585211 RepID=A0A5C4N1E2_9ACTN|nr:hypothetical protein [Mumia zhuanghuii]TNC42919.1 hypothetical protein FHE65_19985 [Mumia zhuanghuii]TNC50669.1 hypothetical protein FHE65_03315 [Mumia zhuanghuii]
MRKIPLLAAAGVGYVLGARAGRERYEQIVTQTKRLLGSQPFQDGVSKATDTVKEQTPVVRDKVSGAARKVTDKVTPGSGGDHVEVEEELAWTTSTDEGPRS